jgi:DNA ligase-1
MFLRLPAAGCSALVKILSGDLRIGLKEGLVEEAVAVATGQELAAVRDANMLLGDLGATARLAREGRLEEAALRLFHPVRSMLASPQPSAEAVVSHFAGNFWIEEKFDGIRAQVHASGGRVEIFSREMKQLTPVFPELVASAGRLAREIVLDGEVLAWAGGRPASFFELQKRLGREGGDLFLGGEIPVIFVAFDILQFNGRTLVGETLSERRRVLEGLPWQDPFRLARAFRPESAAAVDTAFDAAREAGFEGLLAKDPESRYQPGRRGGAWVKLKKRFATLDVVVTAVQYGHGRRRDVLSDYTFAVRDAATGALANIGKAYSGLTDAEIAGRTGYFLDRLTKQKGSLLEVVPELVLEVAFDAIRRSPRHASGLALRFPRIVRIRTDKTVADIDTIESAARLIAE